MTTICPQGKTQERIARVKGYSQPKVAERLKYADFPELVKGEFVTNENLKEGHAREIIELSHCDNLSPWLTREEPIARARVEGTLKRGGVMNQICPYNEASVYLVNPILGVDDLPDYLTVDETAELLGYNPFSVRRMAREGKIQADKKAGVWLIYRESVEEYLESVKGKSKHDPTRGT